MLDFTPGPWRVWEGGVVVLDDAIEGNVICLEPEHLMRASLASWAANANLIAAAPDLFEAGVTARDLFQRLQDDYPPSSVGREWVDNAIAALNSVLARAEGQPS